MGVRETARGLTLGAILLGSLVCCDRPAPAAPGELVAPASESALAPVDRPADPDREAQVAAPTSQPATDAQGKGDDGYEASVPTTRDDGSELYGSAFSDGVPEVPLAQLLANPQAYADRTVRTAGRVNRVCQNMGCWMELADEAGGGELRTPLAGHSYFLPQSVIGKRAAVEGRVSVRPLSDAQRAHLESEGAKATTASVSIIASGVAVH